MAFGWFLVDPRCCSDWRLVPLIQATTPARVPVRNQHLAPQLILVLRRCPRSLPRRSQRCPPGGAAATAGSSPAALGESASDGIAKHALISAPAMDFVRMAGIPKEFSWKGTPRCLRSWCNPRDQDGVKPSISAGTRLLRAVLRLSRAKFSLMNQPDWTAFVLLDMTPRAMAQQARLVATRLRDPEGVSC